MEGADFLIVGGGIAGLSAAARLARHGRCDRARGRGGARLSQLRPKRLVQPLRHRQRGGPRPHRAQPALLRGAARGLLRHADQPGLSHPLFRRRDSPCPRSTRCKRTWPMSPTRSRSWDRRAMAELCPVLADPVRGLFDPTGLKLDADASAPIVRPAGPRRGRRDQDRPAHRTDRAARRALGRRRQSRRAGPDQRRRRLGRRPSPRWPASKPLGLQPKRRTIIVVDPPAGTDSSRWPFAHSAAGDFYMLPEAGQILVSPVDEVDADPCDARPDDYDVAYAADRLEHYTSLRVTPDRPSLGRAFAPSPPTAPPPPASLRTRRASSGWPARAATACRPRRPWPRSSRL